MGSHMPDSVIVKIRLPPFPVARSVESDMYRTTNYSPITKYRLCIMLNYSCQLNNYYNELENQFATRQDLKRMQSAVANNMKTRLSLHKMSHSVLVIQLCCILTSTFPIFHCCTCQRYHTKHCKCDKT